MSGQPGARGWPGAAGSSERPNLADLETDIEILIFELHKLRTEFDELRQSLSGLLRPRLVPVARSDKRLRERRGT